MDIEVKNVYKSFENKPVLKGFSAHFPAGEMTCVMGPSGYGKTTLLNLIMGLMQPDSGSITGVPEKISAVFQEDRLCEDFSAVGNVRAVTGKRVPAAQIEAHLKELGLNDSMYVPVRTLSGGMRRRVALARAVLYGGDLLVLDEAFKGLDEETKRITMDYLRTHAKGKTVIAVTHDAEEAAYLGGNLIRMEAVS